MTDPTPQTEEAREAEIMGEKPDLGRTPDAMTEALSGSGGGSDMRAGSLRGRSAAGSEDDPDQVAIDASLARQGLEAGQGQRAHAANPDPVKNTGAAGGDDADAARG